MKVITKYVADDGVEFLNEEECITHENNVQFILEDIDYFQDNPSEESYILDSITQIKAEVHQNNLMLKDLCNAVNVYLANHRQENEDDFGRNILANLISNVLDISKVRE